MCEFQDGRTRLPGGLANRFPRRPRSRSNRTHVVISKAKLNAIGAAILAITLGLATPALAASPSFLPGARVGLVPPAGMVPSGSFQVYEDAGRKALLMITELGAETARV